jgi:rhamnosyltransferase
MPMSSSVAIIMRAKNEMPYVKRALERLGSQTFQDFELHCVDSGSTDGTLEALRTACPPENLTEIRPEDYIPGKVINDAVARTNADIIVLLNADAVPLSNDWLEKLLQPILEHDAEAAFSKQVARPDARFIVAYDYERGYCRANMAPDFFSAVACAFKRSLWEEFPFSDDGYAEDSRWASVCYANGARIRFVGRSRVEHSHNYTFAQLRAKRYRQAKALKQKSNALKSAVRCFREIIRDTVQALRKMKLRTIPYNIAYRITIHYAMYKGAKDA